jgi:chromosome segregation ATPase
MHYITRNANVILLFLILLSAVSLAGATVYFQDRFESLNEEYSVRRAQLDNLTVQVKEYESTLHNTSEELALKGSREEELTAKFVDVKKEKESLAEERDRLINEKNAIGAQLASTQTQLSESQKSLSLKNALIASINADLAREKAYSSDLDDEVDCLRSTADASEGTC